MDDTALTDRVARRSLLKVSANPDTRSDYLSLLEARFHPLDAARPVALTVRYVPDRELLAPESLGDFLAAHDKAGWDNLEVCAAAILDDLANELVPRWLQITLEHNTEVDETLTACLEQRVIMEDRQPSWNNADLLNRLAHR